MGNKDNNVAQLVAVAVSLGHLLPEVTFIGGCTTVLLVDESAYFGIRKTEDVDVIADLTTQSEYHHFSSELRKLGFREDVDGPICRWKINNSLGRFTLDVMPTDEKILGFSNRWYKDAIRHANEIGLTGDIKIQVVSPAYFIATKFEAFAGRGNGNFFSHDLEDIFFVMENRDRIIFELMDSSDELKHYFSKQAATLLHDDFLNVLPGLLNNPESSEAIIHSLNIMKSWR